jgi:hypothetical protein
LNAVWTASFVFARDKRDPRKAVKAGKSGRMGNLLCRYFGTNIVGSYGN